MRPPDHLVFINTFHEEKKICNVQTEVRSEKEKQLFTCSQANVRSYTRIMLVLTRLNGLTTLVIWNSDSHALNVSLVTRNVRNRLLRMQLNRNWKDDGW